MKNVIKAMGIGLAACCLSVSAVQAQPKLNADNIDEVIQAMTLEEKVRMCIGCGMAIGDDAKFPGTAGRTYDIPRLGIPSVYLADGPHRLAMTTKRDFDSRFYYTTEFPSGTTVAATFNPEAAFKVGAALGEEVKDYGLDVLLAPGANLIRNVLCGRNHEYYSEDPVVTGRMAAAYINGVQSQGTGTCLKHFAVNNQETNRNNNDSRLTQRPLRELYLKGFEIAVKESQPWAIMTAYNKVNGKYTCEDKDLTEDILRGDWGFRGMVMSDWTSTYTTLGCVESGLDLEMPKGYWLDCGKVKELLDNGVIQESQIDAKCVNILKTFIRFGLLDRPAADAGLPEDNPECHRIAYDVAVEGPVLLKNTGILPLSRKCLGNLAVMGPNADIIPFGGGSGEVTPIEGRSSTLLSGLTDAAGKRNVMHIGLTSDMGFDEEAVRKASAVIISAGFTKTTEREGADRTFNLPAGQDGMIRKAASLNDNVVVIINSGGEVAMPWIDEVEAVVMAWYPGQAGGQAMADILTGKVSPSGRLPFTIWGSEEANPSWPYYSMRENTIIPQKRDRFLHTVYYEGIFSGYRGADRVDAGPLYPFGYGLTYSDFSYSSLSVTSSGDGYDVTFELRNTGDCRASEVAQVYVSECEPEVPRPARELKGFAKVTLAPGETKTVTIRLDSSAFSHYDIGSGSFAVTPGDFMITVAADAADDGMTALIHVE